MAEEKIIIDIDEDGKISAKTEGLKGEICITEIDEILGNSAEYESIVKTDEFNQKVTKSNYIKLNNRG